MTLRARLTLFFAGIVVVPLLAATLVLQTLVTQEVRRRSDTRLEAASATVATLWQERLTVADRETRRAAVVAAGLLSDAGLEERMELERGVAGLDFFVITNPQGGISASAVGQASFSPRVRTPTPFDIVDEQSMPGLLRARVPITPSGNRGTVVGGWFVDSDFLRELAGPADVELGLRSGRLLLAATDLSLSSLPVDGSFPLSAEDGRRVAVTDIQRGEIVLATAEEVAGVHGAVWAVALLGLLLASMLGYLLAGVIARPVYELAEGARRVAEGDLHTRVTIGDRGDIGNLANAFNQMTENLDTYVTRLEESRDELRRNLDRLGETLRSTHDLDAMLGVIVDTAAGTLHASAGAMFFLSPSGKQLRLQAVFGYEPPPVTEMRLGQGIAGRAAEGRPVLVPSRLEEAPGRAPAEPVARTAVAVPLVRGSNTIGVLALYGRTLPDPFNEDDAATLASFAGQASVAIENVLLHQEAERLSLTDGLTGVWNRRYLQLQLQKEIDRANRFSRPLSLLLVDIDRFKEANDEHGHLVGDEALVEVVRRLIDSTRSNIDVVARFGGEEFVALLPETPREGARVVAEKVRQAIALRPIEAEGVEGGLHITVSVGVASYPEDGTDADALIRAADRAMYRAKEAGRDRVELAVSGESTPTGSGG